MMRYLIMPLSLVSIDDPIIQIRIVMTKKINVHLCICCGILHTGAYFTETVSKAGSIVGSDWSDTLLRPDVQKKLCAKASGKY